MELWASLISAQLPSSYESELSVRGIFKEHSGSGIENWLSWGQQSFVSVDTEEWF